MTQAHFPGIHCVLFALFDADQRLDRQAMAQLEDHLGRHCDRGGLVVLTTHQALALKPAGYRALELGWPGP